MERLGDEAGLSAWHVVGARRAVYHKGVRFSALRGNSEIGDF